MKNSSSISCSYKEDDGEDEGELKMQCYPKGICAKFSRYD